MSYLNLYYSTILKYLSIHRDFIIQIPFRYLNFINHLFSSNLLFVIAYFSLFRFQFVVFQINLIFQMLFHHLKFKVKLLVN